MAAHVMKSPIFIAGLPRTGTTWIANVLSAAPGTAYYHEPFNFKNVPESAPFSLRYVSASDDDPAFAEYCRKCFSGRQRHPKVIDAQPWWRCWLPVPTGRVMVKDVHSVLALDWIRQHIAPRTVLVLRHPCAMANSWVRNNWKNEGMYAALLEQPALLDGVLKPFESHLRSAQGDYFSRLGAYWGACYHVALEQQKHHQDWVVIRHEDLLENPGDRFHELAAGLDLPWIGRMQKRLERSNSAGSDEPFAIKRLLEEEKVKWRKQLEPEQIRAIQAAASPFGISAYALD